MNLLLVRHAEAAELGENGITRDYDRPLTRRGQEQAGGLAAALRIRGFQPDRVLSSPFVRTQQTAESLVTGLGCEAVVTCPELASGAMNPQKLSRVIGNLRTETVVLVGHMPDISVFAGWLLGTDEAAFPFEKGAAALIGCPATAIPEAAGWLEWFLTPEWYLGPAAR